MEQKTDKGILYIIATPIGNLEDITLRALRILQDVDVIAAEDTRHTRKLLNAHGIQARLTSLFDQNEREKSGLIISMLKEGKDIAYVSDAGTPGISDPGFILIKKAINTGIRVVPIPGVSAVITALSVSGLPMDSFVFYAFLPHTEGKKKNFFESLRNETRTMIFYDSPRRLQSTLGLIGEILGEDRQIVVARELTKIHEEIIRATVGQASQILEGREIKGEITILLGGCAEKSIVPEINLAERCAELQKDPSLSTKDIISILTIETGMSKRDVYKWVISKSDADKKTGEK